MEKVKLEAIGRSVSIKRTNLKKERQLQCELDFLLCQEFAQPGVRSKDIRRVKQELEERYRGAGVRARAERLWCGEVPTKLAVTDEKSYATKNEIRAVEYKNEVTTDKTEIEHAFVEYFQELLGGRQSGHEYV